MLCLLCMAGYCPFAQTTTTAAEADSSFSVITLAEDDFREEGAQQYSSLLAAARDPLSVFSFTPIRFTMRGYDADFFYTSINGLPMNSLDDGRTPWAMWSGLTEVVRRKEDVRGLQPSEFSFGGMGGAVQLDVRAGKLRPQTGVTYALLNRTYNHRFGVSYATGFNAKGWAWALCAGMRWAGEGYVPGTFYNSKSYYAGVSKKLGSKQVLSIVLLGADTRNGRQAASVQQAKEAAGDVYYNPSWGYQQGRKRNANIAGVHQPLYLVTHDYLIGEKASLVTTAGFSAGRKSVTALDWYQAADPRPDYYRYLPGYQSSVALQQQIKKAWAGDPAVSQINWEHLYDVNNTSPDKRASYILEDRVVSVKRWLASAIFTAAINNQIRITAGVSSQRQGNHYYKQVNDLLGGMFYVDINQFAERDFPGDRQVIQNDLNRPDRQLLQGDRFGYDYIVSMRQEQVWVQLQTSWRKVEVFAAAQYTSSGFQREGLVRNGQFPLNSFGISSMFSFGVPGYKAGVTYKLNGRHYLFLRAAILAKAPYFNSVYLSARTRDMVQEFITTEKTRVAEGGYVLQAPAVKLRITGYMSSFKEGMKVSSFYHDDYNGFVNNALRHINKYHFGSEMGWEAVPFPDITIRAVAAIGRYYYTGRQKATVTADNDARLLDRAIVYVNNFRIGNTPQEAYHVGFSYRSPASWFLNVSGNYFCQQWLEINPLRRTPQAVDNLDPDSRLYHDIIDQVQWPPQYTVDLFAGYNKKLPARWMKNTILVVYAGISNLLNNRGIVSGGYEQQRFDALEKELTSFPPKTWAAFGINGFLSIAFRF